MKKILFVVYFLFIISFVFFSYVFVDPNLMYLKFLFTNFAYQQREITTGIYISLILVFFLFYSLFLWKIKTKKITPKDGFVFVGISLLLLFAYPAMVSFDIFNYIATAKVLFHYHENPYLIMPIAFAGDPLLLFMHAGNKVALYGFVWILLTGIPYVIGFGNFLLILFNFKFFVLLFFLATLWIIWKISKNMFSVFLFGLNPLVLFEVLVGGHNDIVMMFLTLFSFYFIQKKKILAGTLIFCMSLFIKYTTVVLIPVFVYLFIQTIRKKQINWNTIYVISALLLVLVFLFIAPIREEIYPWYAIWFLSFMALIPQRKVLVSISLAFSFGLLLRYVPFMLLGTYFGITPMIKVLVTFTPPAIVVTYFIIKLLQKKCRKYYVACIMNN